MSDLYSRPFDQIQEQLRILIEKVKEQHEHELINNPEYGLLANVAPSMKLAPRTGAPTPDDLDELIARVWKEPAFFLAHPRGHRRLRARVHAPRRSASDRQSVRLAVPHLARPAARAVRQASVVEDGKTTILLLRTGEKKQGVVGLFQPGVPGEVSPSLSVRFMGINRKAIASYLVSLYCSLAVLTEDALGVLESVEVGKFHEYGHSYAATAVKRSAPARRSRAKA